MVSYELVGHEGNVFHLYIKKHDLFQKTFITIEKIPKNRNLLGFCWNCL
jgi:hypothetical protein